MVPGSGLVSMDDFHQDMEPHGLLRGSAGRLLGIFLGQGVFTGRYSVEALRGYDAVAVFEDLSLTESVVAAITG